MLALVSVRLISFVSVAYVGFVWIAVLLCLQFILFSCLLLLLIDEPWCYRVDYTMLPCPDPGVLPLCICRSWIHWHLVAQHVPDIWLVGTWLPNTYRTFGSLALGCPTHYLAYGSPRPGTWLPNSIFWHLVAQHTDPARGCPTSQHGTHVPNMRSGHSAVHIIWSRWTSFISAVILYDISYLSDPMATCDALSTFSTSCTWSANCICLSSTFSTTFHAHQHDVSLPRPLLLFGCEFTGTPVDSDLYLFHFMYISTLRYLAAPDVMSWRYSIIWSRSSQCLMILSVSIHPHVEPFVICWLYGSHVMIRATLCSCCASSFLQNCYTHGYAQSLSGVPSWNVIMLSCSSTCYYHGLWFLFSVTYCYYDDKLLYCRSVGAAFLIYMDIVLLIRCWLYWTMIW